MQWSIGTDEVGCTVRCSARQPEAEVYVEPTDLTRPEENDPSGVISFPLASRALRMSKVAAMLANASQTPMSAKRRPGHILSIYRG